MTKELSSYGAWMLRILGQCNGYGPSDYINIRRALMRLARQGYASQTEVWPRRFAITDAGRVKLQEIGP